MISTSRRIYLYWLLLLAAALGVGVGAWLLLKREESRLLLRAKSVETARAAAVEARARLVAENVELLVGDVQAGLIDTLADAPGEGLGEILAEWERTNPLVRTAFLASDAGRLLRPGASGGSDEARGFHRRFAAKLATQPPWKKGAELAYAPAAAKAQVAEADAELRQQINSNVLNTQNARREVQALAKDRSSYASNRAPSLADANSSARSEPEKKHLGMARERPMAQGVLKAEAAPDVRRGWWPLVADGRLHLLGWVWAGEAVPVRGVEVELAALVSRLGGAMPAEVSSDEGYALRDDKGRVQHQAGSVPAEAIPILRVPVAAEFLPGWEVVAFNTAVADEYAGGGFFLVGSLMSAVLVLAIVGSGSLLLRQAKRSEAEAAQKTSFVANVSHEFKTPLTTIRLYAELLEQGRVADAAKRSEYLGTIGRETQRLARLVNNVLDFSRLEQGRKKFERVELDLVAEVARLLDTHTPRVAEAGMSLQRELPAGPLVSAVDRDAFEQIVLNLLDNACKYGASGGEVTVVLRARAGGGGAELRVQDRGPGVPAEQRERIFEKFHRVDDTLTAEKGGAGLGLSIARQLARGLGGELRCEARPGGGAEFILALS